MDKEIYTEAAGRSLLSFITVCTGKRNLPYTGNSNGRTENIDIGFHQITDEAGLHAGMDGLQ